MDAEKMVMSKIVDNASCRDDNEEVDIVCAAL